MRILVLKDGQVDDEGKLDELLERCAEMQRLWYGEVLAGETTAPIPDRIARSP